MDLYLHYFIHLLGVLFNQRLGQLQIILCF